jgi:hypothetical protein
MCAKLSTAARVRFVPGPQASEARQKHRQLPGQHRAARRRSYAGDGVREHDGERYRLAHRPGRQPKRSRQPRQKAFPESEVGAHGRDHEERRKYRVVVAEPFEAMPKQQRQAQTPRQHCRCVGDVDCHGQDVIQRRHRSRAPSNERASFCSLQSSGSTGAGSALGRGFFAPPRLLEVRGDVSGSGLIPAAAGA